MRSGLKNSEKGTSLGVLRSSAQILERSIPESGRGEAAELAGFIGAEVDRLGGVVNDLLTLARPRQLQLERTTLSAPLLRAADFVEPQAQQQGTEILRAPADVDSTLLCDPELIYEVALNLLVNALHATEGAGKVELRLLPPKRSYVAFEVRDEGPGIPAELREQIFLPFVSAREGGVGLGLTFVKRVVHGHGGRVSLETEIGVGTTFRVELPADKEVER